MPRILLAAVFVVALASGVAVAQYVDDLPRFDFWRDQDVAIPAGTLAASPIVTHDQLTGVLLLVADPVTSERRLVIRTFGAAATPAPVELDTMTCPGSHPACRVLPIGTYNRAWADASFPR